MNVRHKFDELVSVFEHVCDLPADERARWLTNHCPDPAMRSELEAMLAADQETQILDRPPEVTPELPGFVIGSHLGDGGMGAVYAAQRIGEGYSQKVAVKFLHRHLVGSEFSDRFTKEQAILARLDHPHIARLIDGGTTASGQPFLVMEMVTGSPITDYCRDRHVPLTARIGLFADVCDAVQHAHAALIVHRDIKPSNVIVNDAGRAVLLDFGIAKVIENAPQNEPITRLMTPQYASPEQLRGEPASTLADVYALGVMLYELLCGERPYQGVNDAMLLDQISSSRLTPPSEIAAGAGEAGARALRGDLDLIVARAMHPDPARRYQSAAQLAEDLRHFLGRRPIMARPDTLWYRMTRLVQRHRLASALTAALLLTVAGATAVLLVQFQETRAALTVAERERQTAQNITGFLVDLFELSDPTGARSESLTVRDMLLRGSRQLRRAGSKISPQERQDLGSALARVLVNLGDYTAALELVDEAVEQGNLSVDQELTRALALRGLGQFERAETAVNQVIERAENALTTVEARFLRAMLERDRGRYQPHLEQLINVLALQRELLGADHPDVTRTRLQLGSAYWLTGDMTTAESHYLATLDQQRRILHDEHPQLASTLTGLSILAHRRGDYEIGAVYGQEALRIQRAVFGPNHEFVARILANLGALYLDAEEADTAREHLLEALAIESALDPPASSSSTMNNLGLIELRADAFAAAEVWFRKAVAAAEEQFPDSHPQLASYRDNLGLSLLRQQRTEEARILFEQSLTARFDALGPNHPHLAFSLIHMAEVDSLDGQHTQAIERAERALAIRREVLGSDHDGTRTAQEFLAGIQATALEASVAEAEREQPD